MKELDIIELSKKEKISDDELTIMMNYEEIYYYNKNTDKTTEVKQNRLILQPKNHIFYRYEVINKIGKGAFSTVYKCKDYKRNFNVAVKVIRNEPKFHKQANKYEIPALLKIQEIKHPNLLKVLKIFDFEKHICFSFELLTQDIYATLKQNNFTPFEIKDVKKYSRQILSGLDALRKLNIIHCDLKPENIMLTNENNIKIIDLGSCYLNTKNKKLSNTYIQSRYYRSPEVILGCEYDYGIDIWSFGCIVFEMLTGKPLFNARSEEKILNEMIKLIGLPNRKILLEGLKANVYFEICDINVKIKSLIDHYNVNPNSLSFEMLYKTEESALYNFLRKIINWDYKNRPTPSELLNNFF